MSFIQICTCESILEKEILLSQLRNAGVEAESPTRSISRKYTDTTIDLAFGGYSTVMGGFKIYVNEAHEEAARGILKDFIKNQETHVKEFKSSRSDLSRFYLFAIFSTFIPILSHAFGLYFLIQALKKREVSITPKFISAAILFSFTLSMTIFIYFY